MEVVPSPCEQAELTCAYAVQALAPADRAMAEAHISSCPHCQRELASLAPVADLLAVWPTDVLRPAADLRTRLAQRIGRTTGTAPMPPVESGWAEPAWEAVAPGIECKLLASDDERQRISMLVRLAPGANYPAHTHAGVEELHLLDGELWIDSRKLLPGDYNYGAPGAADEIVRSDTGCTCVLITSVQDALRG